MMTEPAKPYRSRPSTGRKPLPLEEKLVPHGIHLRRHKSRLFKALVGISGESQRVMMERLLEAEAARQARAGHDVEKAVAKIAKAEAAQ